MTTPRMAMAASTIMPMVAMFSPAKVFVMAVSMTLLDASLMLRLFAMPWRLPTTMAATIMATATITISRMSPMFNPGVPLGKV